MWTLCLFVMATIARADDKNEDFYTGRYSLVETLTDATFSKKVFDSDEMWLVEFYAPWCGHCKKLQPIYEKVARYLKGVVRVGAVNMDQEKQRGTQYGVKGFPSIFFFGLDKSKNPVDYQGGRDADSIVDYVLQQVRKNVNERVSGKSKPKDKKTASSGSRSNKD